MLPQDLAWKKCSLDEEAMQLSNFIGYSPLFDLLPVEEQELLREQCETMWEYSEILGRRLGLAQGN